MEKLVKETFQLILSFLDSKSRLQLKLCNKQYSSEEIINKLLHCHSCNWQMIYINMTYQSLEEHSLCTTCYILKETEGNDDFVGDDWCVRCYWCNKLIPPEWEYSSCYLKRGGFSVVCKQC
jgi:hypothetical protein